jgi:cell division protein FtsZ
VSEASSIIRHAAHEEAHIIFGAVVDVRMDGRVKITVIATGFDPAGEAVHVPPMAATFQTPVDLQSYSSWRAPAERVATRLGIGRRPGIELPAVAAAVGGGAPQPLPDETPSQLDIPAFLRRQSEG